MRIATEIGIWGLDKPSLMDDDYLAALHSSAERGASIIAVISPAHQDLASLLPLDTQIHFSEVPSSEFMGWRYFSNPIRPVTVHWTSRTPSLLEREVHYRNITSWDYKVAQRQETIGTFESDPAAFNPYPAVKS